MKNVNAAKSDEHIGKLKHKVLSKETSCVSVKESVYDIFVK